MSLARCYSCTDVGYALRAANRALCIQHDDQKMTGAHRCANTQQHQRQFGAFPNHSSISDPIGVMLLIGSPATETLRWVRALPTAGSFPALPCLIHGYPSALITHQTDSPTNKRRDTRMHAHGHAHTRTNQGHEAR